MGGYADPDSGEWIEVDPTQKGPVGLNPNDNKGWPVTSIPDVDEGYTASDHMGADKPNANAKVIQCQQCDLNLRGDRGNHYCAQTCESLEQSVANCRPHFKIR